MDHMKKNWDLEIEAIREAARNQKVELSNHAEQQMKDRGLDPITLMMTIMAGKIVEGYDSGDYPKYRNPDPFRMVAAEVGGRNVIVGVADKAKTFTITTCYVVNDNNRKCKYF